jgi:hypothetical protein
VEELPENVVSGPVAYISSHFEEGRPCILFLEEREGGSTLLKLLEHYNTSRLSLHHQRNKKLNILMIYNFKNI